MARHRIAWTDAADARLVELYRRGDSFADMSAELRRSESSLRSRVFRLRALGVLEGRYGRRCNPPDRRGRMLTLTERRRCQGVGEFPVYQTSRE